MNKIVLGILITLLLFYFTIFMPLLVFSVNKEWVLVFLSCNWPAMAYLVWLIKEARRVSTL
jgi:hypothetical protein